MTQNPLPPLIASLPDEISIQCIARVPRSSHPFLALVSRSWRSVLQSPVLFAVRSDLACTQTFLYINIRTPTDQSQWYLLDRCRQNPSPLLLPLPPPPLPTVGSACTALDAAIFLLGGSLNGIPSSTVQIFDARLNRWKLGPRMRAAREFGAAGAHAGRIYCVGGCLPPSDSWAEVLDPVHGRWDDVPSPAHVREKWMHGSAVIGGKLLAVADRGGMVFDPAAADAGEEAWGPVTAALDLGWRGKAAVVGGVLYSYDFLGKIRGYDPAVDGWRTVEGVERDLPNFLCGATLADLGGLLCLVWEGRGNSGSKEMEICCAVIEISKIVDSGLRGSIVWSDSTVLAVPKGSSVSHCLSMEF